MLTSKVTTKSKWHVLLLGCAQQEISLFSHTRPFFCFFSPAHFARSPTESRNRVVRSWLLLLTLTSSEQSTFRKLFWSAEWSWVFLYPTNQVTARVKRWRGKYRWKYSSCWWVTINIFIFCQIRASVASFHCKYLINLGQCYQMRLSCL